jgi:uncharacterized protein YndB with AHSA1/START domain
VTAPAPCHGLGTVATVDKMSDIEVAATIDAPPDQVWSLIGDPTAMGGLTAECIAMQWAGRSSGPAIGARFQGRNRSGWRRWTTACTIVRYQPGTEIAWDVAFGPLPIARWGYRVEPGDGPATTVISERFEDHRGSLLRATSPLVRGTRDTEARNRANMAATLDRIKSRAEAQ